MRNYNEILLGCLFIAHIEALMYTIKITMILHIKWFSVNSYIQYTFNILDDIKQILILISLC
jgi:hypothetical protein